MVLLADAAAAKDAAEATARTIQDVTSIVMAGFTVVLAVLTGVTARLLWTYTDETQRLRVATEKMLAESQTQTKNIQKQNENILLPILFPGEGERNKWEESNFLVIRNIGTGPAFNIEITPVHKTIGVTEVRASELATILSIYWLRESLFWN